MRKIILISIMALSLIGCSKDNLPIEQTFFVNAYYTYSEYPDYGERIADNTFVALYKDNGNEVDASSINTLSQTIYDNKGNELSLCYVSNSKSGINTFSDIPNGKYVILAIYYPYSTIRYYSYKKINVTYDYRAATEKIVFDCSKDSGYQPWK